MSLRTNETEVTADMGIVVNAAYVRKSAAIHRHADHGNALAVTILAVTLSLFVISRNTSSSIMNNLRELVV